MTTKVEPTFHRANNDNSVCVYCKTKIGMAMKCPGCGHIDPPVITYTETVSDCCRWCDCEYPDHSCRECHMDNTEIACSKSEGLCSDCRLIQEGRL